MTTLIILMVVVLSSLVVTVLVLYAIGKISSIEQLTSQLMSQGEQSPSKEKLRSGPFNGLQGKALWDMLSEKNVPADGEDSDLEPMREQYTPVLLKTIKSVFSEGVSDGKFGQPRGTPKNERPIKTLRLNITTWMPSQELSSLYNIGYDCVNADRDERARLSKTLEEVIGAIFSKIKTPAPAGLADSLLAESVAPLAADAQGAQDSDSAGMSGQEVEKGNETEGGPTS